MDGWHGGASTCAACRRVLRIVLRYHAARLPTGDTEVVAVATAIPAAACYCRLCVTRTAAYRGKASHWLVLLRRTLTDGQQRGTNDTNAKRLKSYCAVCKWTRGPAGVYIKDLFQTN
eukprot:15634-Heterococcus_DN1.PRE.1